MRQIVLPVVVVVACMCPAWASNPGEPLDCSDWVILEPGIVCSAVRTCSETRDCLVSRDNRALDNGGNTLRIKRTSLGTSGCGFLARYELVRQSETGTEVLAYLDERCGPSSSDKFKGYCDDDVPGGDQFSGPFVSIENGAGASVAFSPTEGRLLVTAITYHGQVPPSFDVSVFEFTGFSTLFEILQTYEPTSGPLSFRVPYMPEGFPGASYFDTYYGDLATVGDWSQAQPLQCEYPASPPEMGDYLTVTDPLPDPPVNHGRYYVTAVNYMGQVRYGRKSSGGVLTGRDPALLPACE